MVQLYLTILLLIVELVAFAWLIIDIQKSKKKQDKIIELEKQILQLEGSIMELEHNIIDEIKDISRKLENK
ncbi:MAG: hypothetical protein VX370_01175 [Bacteroidota bacterium]|nr:hypothetical protein [Bacteroidota bacterium]|tara:strand:- start:316 stop:528 length:213 start_codon:yes stop_codon:yes gene_type:complete